MVYQTLEKYSSIIEGELRQLITAAGNTGIARTKSLFPALKHLENILSELSQKG